MADILMVKDQQGNWQPVPALMNRETWETLAGKPFATIGKGLEVKEGELVATGDVDTSKFATKEELAEVEGKIPDTSDLATKQEVKEVEDKIPDTSNLATKQELAAVGAQIPDTSNLATKTEVEAVKTSIPASTSQLTNDSGFINSDALDGYVQSDDSRLSDSRTPTAHAVNANTYGLGTATLYGHCRVINNVTRTSYTTGEALSAYQGKVLSDRIAALESLTVAENSSF